MRVPLVGAGVVAVAAALRHGGPALVPVMPLAAGVMGIPTRIDSRDGVAITFDDGPHPQATPRVLELLAAEDAEATFFLVGEQVGRYPELAGEVAARGHAVGVHCYRHRNMLRLTSRQIREDLKLATSAIADAIEREPVLHRPPYGTFSAGGLAEARRALRPILWSRWGRDWRSDATSTDIVCRSTRDLAAGDVILLHDSDAYSDPGCWRAMADALPRLIEAVRTSGLEPEAVEISAP